MGGDLEDKILRQNIPGRYSDHVDDTAVHDRRQGADSDHDSDHDEGDNDNDFNHQDDTSREASIARMSNMAGEGVPESVYRTIEARRLNAPKTGVKGVLADYQQSQALAAARQQQEEIHRKQVLYRMATGRGPPGSGAPYVPPPAPVSNSQKKDDDDSDSDDDALLDGADDFMEQFRQQRIAQMSTSAAASTSAQSSSDNGATQKVVNTKPLPYFGEVICIDDFDPREPLLNDDGKAASAVSTRQEFFLFHLCCCDSRVTTIVHAYEPDIKLCVIVNHHLEKIASLNPHVKFIKMMASANGVDVDPVAMPVLSIYREGECVEVLTDIAEEVLSEDGRGAERLSRTDVEMVLMKYLNV